MASKVMGHPRKQNADDPEGTDFVQKAFMEYAIKFLNHVLIDLPLLYYDKNA